MENNKIQKQPILILEENEKEEIVSILTESEVINNFKDGLNEIHLINQGDLTSRPIQEFFLFLYEL